MWGLLAPSLYTHPQLRISFCLSLSHTQACTWHMHQKIGTYPLLHDSLNWPLFYCNILCDFTPFPSLPTFPMSCSYQRNYSASFQPFTLLPLLHMQWSSLFFILIAARGPNCALYFSWLLVWGILTTAIRLFCLEDIMYHIRHLLKNQL